MSKKFDPERKRLKRLDIYSTTGALGAGASAGVAAARGTKAGIGTEIKTGAGAYKTAFRARKQAKAAPNKGLRTVARNKAAGNIAFANTRMAEAGKILVRTKGIRRPAMAAATLGAISAGAHKYKKSESAQTYGEYKVYGQRSRKSSK